MAGGRHAMSDLTAAALAVGHEHIPGSHRAGPHRRARHLAGRSRTSQPRGEPLCLTTHTTSGPQLSLETSPPRPMYAVSSAASPPASPTSLAELRPRGCEMSSAPRRPGVGSARIAPLTGVASVLLLIVALLLEGTPPAADAATDEVVRYYAENEARLLVGTIVASLAAAALLWFGGSMYAIFRAGEGRMRHVAVVTFGGFVVASVGHTMLFGFVLAAAETVGDVSPEITQTLGVLGALLVVPMAVGMLVAMVASAVAILRHDVLPRWLGYFTIVITAAAALSTWFDAYVAVVAWVLASMVWVAVTSVVASVCALMERPRSSTGAASPSH